MTVDYAALFTFDENSPTGSREDQHIACARTYQRLRLAGEAPLSRQTAVVLTSVEAVATKRPHLHAQLLELAVRQLNFANVFAQQEVVLIVYWFDCSGIAQ